MSDEFEDLLKRWMRDRAGTDRAALQALAGNVAALPPHRRRRGSGLAAAAAVVLALGLAAVVLGPRLGSVSSTPTDAPSGLGSPAPSGEPAMGDPAAFPNPDRLAPCGGLTPEVQYVFETASASEFPRHFPAMTQSIEQLVDVPAIVVVYRGYNPFGVAGSPGSLFTRAPLGPNEHDVCVILETDPPRSDPLFYDAVDTTGLRVVLDEPSPEPTPGLVSASPARAWMTGAAAALGCDGPPSEFGASWRRNALATTDRGTPELALQELANRLNAYGQPFPTAGFDEIGRTSEAVVYAHHARGSARAIVIIRSAAIDRRTVWFVDDLASCDPTEFGPDAAPGIRITGWLDAAGEPVPSTTVGEVADCYFGTRLTVDGWLFVWSPVPDTTYDPTTLDAAIGLVDALPGDAVDTGYRSDGRELHLAADGAAAFVVLPDGIQRWAHVKGDEYQRTDCN